MKRIIDPELAGERIDKVVSVLTGLSRRVAHTLVESGEVLVDGSAVSPKDRVEGGERVTIRIPAKQILEAEDVPFGVRYEDENVAVIDKPAGVVVHPGAGVVRGTLAAGLLHRWPQIRGVGAEDRWGIVHRLDRDTSGLLLVAKTEDAHSRTLWQNGLSSGTISPSWRGCSRCPPAPSTRRSDETPATRDGERFGGTDAWPAHTTGGSPPGRSRE